MDDMDAFDRQIAREVLGAVRPPRQVDYLAIFTAATQSPKWRFQSLFSATKFLVAGAIVALFGGFLLAGVLTQPSDEALPPAAALASASSSPEATADAVPEQPVRSDLLPDLDLEVEEVERGVYRVLSDGAGHDLVAEPPADVALGPDDSLWLLRTADHGPADILEISVDALFRLGQEGSLPFEPSSEFSSDFAVDTDGVVWMATGADWGGGASLATFDGSESTAPTWPDGSTGVAGIETTDDGAVWVTQPVEDGRGPRVARIVDGEWTVLPVLEDPSRDFDFHGSSKYFAAAEDGTAWLGNGDFHGSRRKEAGPRLQGLLHFDGTGWRIVDLPVDPDHPARRWPWRAGQLALGSDGTLWVYLEPRTQGRITCQKGDRSLARLRDGEWTVFGRADGVPTLVCGQRSEAAMAVDDAGRLWVVGPEDGGVRSFDGTTWRQHLGDLRANRVRVLPDGSVVATALYGCPDGICGSDGVSEIDSSQAGLYVITPEAVEAAE